MACFSLVVLSLSCSFLSHVVGVGVTLSVALSMALSMALDETLSMALDETLSVVLGETLSMVLGETLSVALGETLSVALGETLDEWRHTKNIGRISNSRSRSRKQGSTLGCQVM